MSMELLNSGNVPLNLIDKPNLYYDNFRYKLTVNYIFESQSRLSGRYGFIKFLQTLVKDHTKNVDYRVKTGYHSSSIYVNEDLMVELYNNLTHDEFKCAVTVYKINNITKTEEVMYFKRKPVYQYRVYFKSGYIDNDIAEDFINYIKQKRDNKPSYLLIDTINYHNKSWNRRVYLRKAFYLDFKEEKQYIHFNLLYGEYVSKRYKLEQIA